jgi:ABC-type multidrug transport system permease subunit
MMHFTSRRSSSVVWTIAAKEVRLLARDPKAGLILLAMPFVFIMVVCLSVGEGFGQKPDDRLRVSIVDLDQGYTDPDSLAREWVAWLCLPTQGVSPPLGFPPELLNSAALAQQVRAQRFPKEAWSKIVIRDMTDSDINVETIEKLEDAHKLVSAGKRAAVVVFGPNFSRQVQISSFLASGINPFYREGVKLSELDAEVISDPTQVTASSIIKQVAQVSMLRVILPWMIGRAFEKLSEPSFMTMLAEEVPGGKLLPLNIKSSLGNGVQGALKRLFPRYELTGKTWAALTKSTARTDGGAQTTIYNDEGFGLPKRGAIRYQILVPSYTVTFAYFLVLTVGWLFASERRQGTLKRLRAAPLTKAQILLGKLLPCYALSLVQAAFLLLAGKLVFGMRWGPDSWSIYRQVSMLTPVILSTSLAAMGMALLIASIARTEAQVAIIGTPLVLVLAGMSGCLMPRDLMPELMKQVSLITPHAWSLEAYLQLLISPTPEVDRVLFACLVLVGFGVGFLGLAWRLLKLD